jgi:RHS repeat-associated protein
MLFINGGNNGNMIKKVENEIAIAYSYDYANRLIKVRNQHFEVSYGYDGYGRKVYRWLHYIPTEEGVTIPEPEFSSYIWDGANILLELPQNGRVRNPIEYLQGADGLLSAHYLSRLHNGEEKLIEHTTNFYHYDALGSTVNLTDQNGSVTMTYKYDAFGAVTKEENGIGGKKNCYKFVGRYGVQDDPAANLQYMLNRYYDPTIGRFITKDPILELHSDLLNNIISPSIFMLPFMLEDPQDLHAYAYCKNNPIIFIDPKGKYVYGYVCKVIWGLMICGAVDLVYNCYQCFRYKSECNKGIEECNKKYPYPPPIERCEDSIDYRRERQECLDKIEACNKYRDYCPACWLAWLFR